MCLSLSVQRDSRNCSVKSSRKRLRRDSSVHFNWERLMPATLAAILSADVTCGSANLVLITLALFLARNYNQLFLTIGCRRGALVLVQCGKYPKANHQGWRWKSVKRKTDRDDSACFTVPSLQESAYQQQKASFNRCARLIN